MKGHSKTATVFHYLETGALMLRHLLRINRIMYHHHVVNLGDEETVKRIYEKQKQDSFKGDWIRLIKQDFAFMGIEMNEDEIRKTSKEIYRKKIKTLVKKAAFQELLEEKNKLSKIRDIDYDFYEIQPYLKSNEFTHEERILLYALRSRMHPAKLNYRKMHSDDLQCSYGCNAYEDQRHLFQECSILGSKDQEDIYDFIFKDTGKQKQAAFKFIQIERRRIDINIKEPYENPKPGGT